MLERPGPHGKRFPVCWPLRWGVRTAPRILIEDGDPVSRADAVQTLRRAGYTIAICQGPDADAGCRCPLVEQGYCPLAEEADAVVFGLPMAVPETRAVLRALRGLGKPVVIETDGRSVDDVLDAETVPYEAAGGPLARALARLVTRE